MANDSGGMPTAEEFAQLKAQADRSLEIAERAESKADAKADVKADVKAQGLDEQAAEMYANAVVSQIEARGGFGAPPPETPPVEPGAPAAVPGGVPAGQTPVVPPAGEAPPAPEPVGEELPPKKKTLAERFQGK